ncbi:MAG: ADP-ribosylglycohydrolase family protein [Sphaerochaeta sp.]
MNIQERANGALLGLFVGDGFGSQCDGLSKETLQEEIQDTIQEVFSLEHLRSDCGISGEVSDLPLLLCMSLLSNKALDADHFHALVNRYREESEEGFPLDGYRAALPLSVVVAISGIELKQKQVREIALTTASLFCEDSFEKEAVALLAHCFHLLINEEVFDGEKLVHDLLIQRGIKNLDEQLAALLSRAKKPSLVAAGNHTLKETLLLVFHTLLYAPSFEEGMSDIARIGGDSRLACGLYGALTGALQGVKLFRDSWIDELVSSSALEQSIKKQTLFKRETIKMERLAFTMSERLLNASVFGR